MEGYWSAGERGWGDTGVPGVWMEGYRSAGSVDGEIPECRECGWRDTGVPGVQVEEYRSAGSVDGGTPECTVGSAGGGYGMVLER